MVLCPHHRQSIMSNVCRAHHHESIYIENMFCMNCAQFSRHLMYVCPIYVSYTPSPLNVLNVCRAHHSHSMCSTCVSKGFLATSFLKRIAKWFMDLKTGPRVLWKVQVDPRGAESFMHRCKHVTFVSHSFTQNESTWGGCKQRLCSSLSPKINYMYYSDEIDFCFIHSIFMLIHTHVHYKINHRWPFLLVLRFLTPNPTTP